MNSEQVWSEVLELLKLRVNQQAFQTWLAPTRLFNMVNGTVQVAVPNNFFADWLQHHYKTEITSALKAVTGRDLQVEFLVPVEGKKPVVTKPQPAVAVQTGTNTASQFRLRSRYTFDTFIVGESNRLAWAAARNVAQNLGKVFNPLFIYGGVGLGKTHLIQAIGNAALARHPGLRLCYTPAEVLFLELIQAIEKNTRLEFKEKYRGLDLLLLDDVHYLVGKESLQEEIFYTFNALQDAGSQVVFTSDRPPKDIPTLQERLISRLGSGLVVDIQPPELETRIAILLQKAKQENFDLSEDIACYIANRVRSNIRTLEASLVRLIAMHSLTGRPVTTELAEAALKDLIQHEDPLDPSRVITAVAEHFQVPVQELKGQSRTKRIALARQVAMYLMRSVLNLSLKDIGYHFGGKDHTTVMHATEKINELKARDPLFASQIERLSRHINNGS
ncbi:chromosomal replication initiator protein DnaA [candidate division WOR-3 bacterium]|nr:chromosomal replication initiator protein DnaA [candidate division WOR-3 bacterium]